MKLASPVGTSREVVSAQQLHVDVAPGLRHAIAVAHEQVVNDDRPDE